MTIDWLKKTIFLLSFFCILYFATNNAHAQTQTPTPTQKPEEDNEEQKTNESEEKLRKEIQDLENKITELQEEQKTLSSQIEIVDSQVSLSELKIQNTRDKIADLQGDIGITKDKIGDLEVGIDDTTKALIARTVAVYEVGKIQPWQMFLTSDNIKSFLSRLKYLKIVQEADKRTVIAAEQAKVNYKNQQNILGEKKSKEEELEEDLKVYTAKLEEDKQEKENLLTVTKNSENEYQARLADALRELRQISDAAKVLITTEPREVEKGEPIGLMGNTGYSFGAHLHFGIYGISSLSDYNYYSSHENPVSSLEPQTVNWQTECGGDPSGSTTSGNGSFAWPMSTSGLYITQNYGNTCYSSVYYGGRPHPALDMYNNSNITVRAVEKGKAYVCRNCTGDGANGVFLFHENGKMSLYWHLQ